MTFSPHSRKKVKGRTIGVLVEKVGENSLENIISSIWMGFILLGDFWLVSFLTGATWGFYFVLENQ